MGMRLPLDLLAAVHPLVDTPAALQGDLRSLAAAQFLRLNAEDGSWAWTQVHLPAVSMILSGLTINLTRTVQLKGAVQVPSAESTLVNIAHCNKPGRRRWRGR